MPIYQNTRNYKKIVAQDNYDLRKLRNSYWIWGKEHVGKFVKDGNYYLKDRCNGVVMYKKNHYNNLIQYTGPTTRAMTEFITIRNILKDYNIYI